MISASNDARHVMLYWGRQERPQNRRMVEPVASHSELQLFLECCHITVCGSHHAGKFVANIVKIFPVP